MLYRRLALCLFVSYLSINLAVCADAYHWIDADGHSHFGDSYAPGARAIQLDRKSVV